MGLFGRKNKQEKSEEKDFTPAIANAEQTQVGDAGDDELIAVIMAAISASLGTQSNLVIRSIIRVGDRTPIWGQIGRHEQMLNRL